MAKIVQIQQLHEVTVDPGPFCLSGQLPTALVSSSRTQMNATVLTIISIFQGGKRGEEQGAKKIDKSVINLR